MPFPSSAAKRNADKIIERLSLLHPKTIDLSLGRISRLLGQLGNPERDAPPIIHVAGTNGKGSVVAYLETILMAANYRVNSYISPHLVQFNERIRLGGHSISYEKLAESLSHCEKVNDGAPITFFEITTAAAFHALKKTPSDFWLLEVGLGGRLDATNVVKNPTLTVITPVSIDHTDFLGNSLESIATEKAGIFKKNTPAVIGIQEPAALSAIANYAQHIGAPLLRHGYEWKCKTDPSAISVEDIDGTESYPCPQLLGAHQAQNAGLAAACARVLSRTTHIGKNAISEGLRRATWPGRLQQIIWPGLSEDWEIWLDGGHNCAAGAALGQVVKAWSDRTLVLVVGMLKTKPPEDFLRPMATSTNQLIGIAIPFEPASQSPDQIRAAGHSLGIPSDTAESIEHAISDATNCSRSSGRILICGSLYLVGRVLEAAKISPV